MPDEINQDKNEEALLDEAKSLAQAGDLKGTVKKFGDFIKLKPRHVGAYIMRGEVYLKLEKFEEAIKDFSKALELNPDNSHAYYLRGQAYSLNEESEKAVKDFELTLEKIPLSPGLSVNKYSLLLSLGVELFKIGRYKEAKVHLEEVLTASPNNETAQTVMSQIQQKIGD